MGLYFSIFTAVLGGFLYGYHTGVIAAALLLITPAFQLSLSDQGLLVSSILIGALPGALFAGKLADRYGRKPSLLFTALLFLIGTVVTVAADSFSLLVVGRLINGIALGVVSVVTPLYLAEIAPPKNRGAVVSLYQFALAIGIMVSFICGYFFVPEQQWRIMFAIGAIPAALQLGMIGFIPESPHWVAQSIEIEKPEKKNRKTLLDPKFRFVLLIGLILCSFQQMTGINTVIYYAPVIFQTAGFSSDQGALFATMGIGAINVIATFLSVWLLDKGGRRFFLLASSAGMAICLLIFSTTSYFPGAWDGKISALSLMGYVASFAIGLGPVTWVIVSEIYPLRIRATAMTLSIFANWFFNALISWTFLDIMASLGSKGTFLLYAAISTLCFLFIHRYLPETKGKSLEEIEKLLLK